MGDGKKEYSFGKDLLLSVQKRPKRSQFLSPYIFKALSLAYSTQVGGCPVSVHCPSSFLLICSPLNSNSFSEVKGGNSFTLEEINPLLTSSRSPPPPRAIKMLKRGKTERIELLDKLEDLKTQMKFLRGGREEEGAGY